VRGAPDNNPAVFWTYLVTALRAAAPQVGAVALALLDPPRAPAEEFLATLLNDLSDVPDELLRVLGDYHVIDSPQVHAGVGFLLEHLPPPVHLVIAGRTDPPLPLARMRARGELVEGSDGRTRASPSASSPPASSKRG
jgi:LuxR family maltose regulon positive regulatory protein